jgi:hypothetical protein
MVWWQWRESSTGCRTAFNGVESSADGLPKIWIYHPSSKGPLRGTLDGFSEMGEADPP